MSLFEDNSFTHPVDDSQIFHSNSYDDEFASPAIYASGDGISADRAEFSPELNGNVLDVDFGESDGSILPPPPDMLPDEGFALREWRRQNTVRLEEKEKQEKEMLNEIIDEADEFKIDFYRRRTITCESNKTSNREKEKLFMTNLEKFHTEVDKDYWKSIAELVPNEVPTIAKRGKKDEDKKPSIAVIQGPKPGKPTDLSRMRQILIKLKHNTPPHLKHAPIPVPDKDTKTGAPAATLSKGTALEASPEPVAVA